MLLLCNLDTCEKNNNSDSVTMKYCLVLLFLHVSTPISLKRYEIFMLLSTLTPLQLLCRCCFSSVFHGVGSFLTDFLPTISFHTMRFYLQYIPTCYCIYMHSSTSKTWLKTHFLLLFTVSFVCFFWPSNVVL